MQLFRWAKVEAPGYLVSGVIIKPQQRHSVVLLKNGLQINETAQSPEIQPHRGSQPTLNKGQPMETGSFQQIALEPFHVQTQANEPTCRPCTLHKRWPETGQYRNVICKMIALWGQNTGENLRDFGMGDVLRYNTKTWYVKEKNT